MQEVIHKANPGDTLAFEKGVWYVTDLTINKPLTVTGTSQTIIDGRNKSNVIRITSKNVTLQDITVKNSGFSGYEDPAAIKVENSKHVTIKNCTIENSLFGIYFANSSECEIYKNMVSSDKLSESASGNGIHLWKCKLFTINNNHVTGHRDGIYLEFTTDSKISNNISKNNIRYGLHFMFSHNDSYTNNIFLNNGAGVAVMYTKNVSMEQNQFRDNSGPTSYGLLLKDISDSNISDNQFQGNTCAITMEECNRIQIKRNEFNFNGWAIRIQASCSDNIINSNNFIGNTFDISTNGTMVLNNFSGNYWDKYTGYDLNKDNTGDIAFHPVSMYAVITDQIPMAMILYRSFIVSVLEQMEKIIPSITPADLADHSPLMKPVIL